MSIVEMFKEMGNEIGEVIGNKISEASELDRKENTESLNALKTPLNSIEKVIIDLNLLAQKNSIDNQKQNKKLNNLEDDMANLSSITSKNSVQITAMAELLKKVCEYIESSNTKNITKDEENKTQKPKNEAHYWKGRKYRKLPIAQGKHEEPYDSCPVTIIINDNIVSTVGSINKAHKYLKRVNYSYTYNEVNLAVQNKGILRKPKGMPKVIVVPATDSEIFKEEAKGKFKWVR